MDIRPFIQFTLHGTKQGPMWPAWQGARLANQSVQLIDKIQVITKQNEGHEEEKQKRAKMQIHPAHASAQSGVWSQPCNFPATACCCDANPQQPRVVKACLWEEPSVPTMMGKLKCCDASNKPFTKLQI